MSAPPAGGPGWGAEPWGAGAWGGAAALDLQLLQAIALAENQVLLQFTLPVYFSGYFDLPDAANPARYVIQANSGTIGLDGANARPVTVVLAQQTPDVIGGTVITGRFILVTLDRPMTPYPAVYTITANGLFASDLSETIDPSFATVQFPGVYRQIVTLTLDTPSPNRDIANPTTLEAATAAGLVNPNNIASLGVFATDATGDYAIDQGIVAYKKRIYRRLVTRPGAFLHLGNAYGVGIPQQAKKLIQSSTLQKLAALAEQQIAQEPETAAVSVTPKVDPNAPGLVRFFIACKMKSGAAVNFSTVFKAH